MSLAGQLHELQELDLALRTNQQEQKRINGQLGESREVERVRVKLATEKQRLDELTRQQHSLEWEVEDLAGKIGATEEKLFGGTIRNPKELSNLQREDDELKLRKNQLEDRVLELMDGVEVTTTSIKSYTSGLSRLETEWRAQQQQFTTDLEQLKKAEIDLNRKRELLVGQIDSTAVDVYQRLSTQKGTAVAKVEQGICRGCQITLPTTELQQVRGGGLVRCSSCGRILYLA